MNVQTEGTVISAEKQWWFKVNRKPVRRHSFDGAEFPMYFDGTNRYSGTVDSEGVYYVSVTTADGKQARHILRFEDNRVCCLELDLSK